MSNRPRNLAERAIATIQHLDLRITQMLDRGSIPDESADEIV